MFAVRDTIKGEGSSQRIRSAVPGALVEVRELDLSSLESVRAFATGPVAESPTLDLLVNNAGIMMTPASRTAEGYELQLGTNHLGHFALTGLLLEALGRGTGPRVVTVSSIEHKAGHIHFDDLQLERGTRRGRRTGSRSLRTLSSGSSSTDGYAQPARQSSAS